MANVKIGGTLYICSKDTKLLKTPNLRELQNGVIRLQPGTAVIWLGKANEDGRFENIRFGIHTGYTLSQNLQVRPIGGYNLPAARQCYRCNGSGILERSHGNPSAGYVFCSICDGKGGSVFSTQSFPSHGAGTKA